MRMMGLVALGLLAGSGVVSAQDSAAAPTSSAEMRSRIEQRFTERVKFELGLDSAQTARLKAVAGEWFERRRGMEGEVRNLRQALAGQLRPGIAANADSVNRLVNQLLELKVRYAETYREENKQLGFLTPVQRAQYYSLRERLLDALKEARQHRQSRQGPPARNRS